MILALLLTQAAPTQSTPPAPSGPGALGEGIGSPAGSPPESRDLQLPRATNDVRPSITDPQGSIADGGRAESARPRRIVDRVRQEEDRRGDTVALRGRPAYDPIGIRTGSYIIFPEASASAGYDSNTFRQTSGSSDVFTRLRGDVQIQSDLPRHAVLFDGFVDQRLYAKYASEDALTYGGHAFGRLDVDRTTRLTANITHTHAVADRGATGEVLRTRRPIRYDVTSSAIDGRKVFGRLAVEVGGLVSYANYQDAQTPAGARLNQQYRDSTIYQAHVDLGYGVPAGPVLFVSVTGEARRFRVPAPPIIRDADSVEILAGVRSDITPLLRGRLGVGYFYADFKDPTIKSRGAFALDVRLDYLLSQLTTITASARRSLQNVASATAPAALLTEGRVGVDHELLRNLILSASAGYQHADYITSDGTVRRFTVDGGAQYLVNRRMRIDFDLGYRTRSGSGQSTNRDFSQFRLGLGLAYHL